MEISIADGNKWIVSYGVIIGFPNFDAKDSTDVFVALMDLRCERMKEIRVSQGSYFSIRMPLPQLDAQCKIPSFGERDSLNDL